MARLWDQTPCTTAGVISILAGVGTEALARRTSGRIVRVMPNLPIAVGQGATAICAGESATGEDLDRAHRLFAAGGEVYDLPEPALDAFTAAAGSGPALAFLLAQAMAEGALEAGRQAGLTEALARRIVAQTIRGAAEMLKAEQQGQPADPIALRQRVTSPGGTTAAAVELLEARGVPEALRQAVVAAARRSAELGQGLDAPADGQPPQPE